MLNTVSNDSGRKVSLRPQCAAGVSVESTLRSTSRLLNFADDMVPAKQTLKANDLGSILVRVGQTVCLAVREILSFKKKKSHSKQILSSIKADKLRASGEQSVAVTVQILKMRPSCDIYAEDMCWEWQDTYINTDWTEALSRIGDAGTATNQTHYPIPIPGKVFYPLSPVIVSSSRCIPSGL